MNQRKVFGTLAGLIVLAGISYHQVRDAGPDPRDTAIMSGTVLPDRGADSDSAADCDRTMTGGVDDAEAGAGCADQRD